MHADVYHSVTQAEGILAESEAQKIRATVSPQRAITVWGDHCTDKCQVAIPWLRW
jgi:hypothetical protein